MARDHTEEKDGEANPGVSRRQFLQSTIALTGVSVGGTRLLEPARAEALLTDRRLAQAAPLPGARSSAAPPPSAELPPAPDVELQQFISLSETLTGLEHIERDLAKEYFERCALRLPVASQLKKLVELHSALRGTRQQIEDQLRDKLRDALKNGDPIFAAAEQIIYVWYIGAFYNFPEPPSAAAGVWEYGPPSHYFRGKVWKVLGVAPPMSPGGPPDFWVKEPRTSEVKHGH